MQYDSSSLARLDAFESHLIDGLSSRSEFNKNFFARKEKKYVTIKQKEIAGFFFRGK